MAVEPKSSKAVTTIPKTNTEKDNPSDDVAQNLRLLRAILGAPTESRLIFKQPRRFKTLLATVPTPNPKSTRNGATDKGGKQKATVTKAEGITDPPLSVTEQRRLATSCFNQGLKVLSAYVKKRQANRNSPEGEASTSENETVSKELGLVERQNEDQEQAIMNAECATAALTVLRLNDQEVNPSDDAVYKREQGAIMLLDKMISLELRDLAHSQASRILEQYWKRRKDHTSQKLKKFPEKIDLSTLLSHAGEVTDKKDLVMLTSIQSQVLRLAILIGPSVVGDHFVRAISIENEGSPAGVITSSQKRGYMSEKAAGENLRAIAQALFKLYSAMVKSTHIADVGCDVLAFALFAEVQLAKLESWRLAGGEPALKLTFWPAVEKGIKCMWNKQEHEDTSRYKHTKLTIERIKTALSHYNLTQDLPSSLEDFLCRLAEINKDSETALSILAKSSDRETGMERLTRACRIAAITLQDQNLDHQTSERISGAANLLREAVNTSANLNAEDLILVVRLRKACFAKLCSSITREPEDKEQTTKIACLRIVPVISRFCSHFWRKIDHDERLSRSLHLAGLKTLENVLDFEKHASNAVQPILNEFLRCMKTCAEILLEDDTEVSVKDPNPSVTCALKIKLSNALWRAHVYSSNFEDRSITTLELAQSSVRCLDGMSTDELSKAALGPRLEKMTDMFVQCGDLSNACMTIERAIKHYISSGALTDAVESSLSKQSAQVWSDPASLANQLGRALHLRISILMNEHKESLSESLIMSEIELPPIHQAVFLDHQISYLLRKYSDKASFDVMLDTVSRVVELAQEPQYYIWVLRFVSTVVFRASRRPLPNREDSAALLGLLNSVLNADPTDANEFLESYRIVLTIQLKIQRVLLASLAASQELQKDLDDLLKLLKTRTQANDFDSIVDDMECLQSILKAYTDQALATYDYESAATCLKVRIHMEGRRTQPDISSLIKYHTQLASIQVRLDDVEAAGASLDYVAKFIKDFDQVLTRDFDFHLVSAEYHLATSALTKCSSSLSHAKTIYDKLWPQGKTLAGIDQIERDHCIARGALIASTLAFRIGDILLATRYARQATKISMSIWSALEKRSIRSEEISRHGITITSLTKEVSNLQLDVQKTGVQNQLAGSKYWSYLDMHVRSIRHLASILSLSGIYEDTMHYLRQLEKLDIALPGPNLQLSPEPALSLLLAKAGRTGEASEMLERASALTSPSNVYHTNTDALLTFCEAYIAQGQLKKSSELLSIVPALPIRQVEEVSVKTAPKMVKQPSIKARRGIGKTDSIKAPPRRQIKDIRVPKKSALVVTSAPSTGHLSFDQIKNESRRKAIALACDEFCVRQYDAENDKLNTSTILSQPGKTAQELYEIAKFMLSSAWVTLSKDAFASVLTESAMALPARTKTHQKRGRISFIQGGNDAAELHPAIRITSSPDIGFPGSSQIAHKLQSALQICGYLLKERIHDCAVDMIHVLLKMESKILLLLSSMALPFVVTSTDLVLKASQPKDCALERENIVAAAEEATRARSALSVWPCEQAAEMTSRPASTNRKLIDLPESWSIVSLALAEDNNELLLSKTVSGTDPFVVRIPLRRSTDSHDDVDEFLFQDAANEMRHIIEAANSSSHDTRGAQDKDTRAQWHADRERLDKKLASLLENLENVWLGGFRGILSPYFHEAKHVKQFGRCLTQSLNKNLPSRQKNSTIEERINIHDHILEIFLGLGNPEQNDLDDPIMDLLYFVVDILQFNGERNAYDEIDWDVILIDVLDAMKSYYHAAKAQQSRHTILILDKELEHFPWEALPCLINHPVSRMPSLGSIFDRLTQIRARSSSENHFAPTIKKSSAHGAIILNPSGDLTSTQTTLKPILDKNLPPTQYTSLINSPPTETQFSDFLIHSDIVLYIGHGSGAQYIRPRTIRALSSCAVTFLFGCSSAKMTTHGAFESTGMPRAYMLGHAPAVVGCLWDVTDREIDRVALRTLVSWGLVDGDDEDVRECLKKRGRKGKGKAMESDIVRGEGEREESKTLVEAVKDGREACVLRYLCGAAVVVYGVPVTLE